LVRDFPAMKRLLIILLLFILVQNICVAQFKKEFDSLCVLCKNSLPDSDKVVALGKLANLYYIYKYNREADSVLHEQLQLADLSDNNNLLLLVLFGAAITNINSSTTSETFDKTVSFIQKGINYAKSLNKYEYVGLGYSRMANLLRKRGQYDNALTNAQLALGYLSNIKSDSIKAIIYIELGDTYKDKGEAVSASTNYNSAFDIALKIKSVPLQSIIYHCFSEMYKGLGQNDAAKDELKKSLTLDKENGYGEGMVQDYYDLARLTDEKFYIDKALELSDSFHLNKYNFRVKGLMLAYIEVKEKNSDKALRYLESEPDLKQSFLNDGAIGNIYLYSNKADSALYYFKIAEYDYIKNFDQRSAKYLFLEIASCYSLLNDIPNAISYYTRSLELSKNMNDATSIASTSDSLSNLYQQLGDFKQAFIYSKQSTEYKENLRSLSKERDIALMGVDREKRKHEDDLLEEEKRLNSKRNVQYMAITIAIGIVFLGLLFIGMFAVSKLTIKILGYFFFISVFEFIVLLIDNSFLAHATHDEPLKLWLIKIVLIAMLVPLQHFLEHNLIKFLESRKLLEVRTKFSSKKWWQKMKKPAPVIDAGDIEKDTAVL
jgi:tetratricopeptide (TPR) repeat protein